MEHWVKSSKPGALEQNICALCSQFLDFFTTKANFAERFAPVKLLNVKQEAGVLIKM